MYSLPFSTLLQVLLIVALYVAPVVWALLSPRVSKAWLVVFVVIPVIGPAAYLATMALSRRSESATRNARRDDVPSDGTKMKE